MNDYLSMQKKHLGIEYLGADSATIGDTRHFATKLPHSIAKCHLLLPLAEKFQ